MLEKGADPNKETTAGYTPLIECARSDNTLGIQVRASERCPVASERLLKKGFSVEGRYGPA